MGITVETTPNLRAMKFSVGAPVGVTVTATSANGADERIAGLFTINGVESVFMTADFVTVTRSERSEWGEIIPAVVALLEDTFSQ